MDDHNGSWWTKEPAEKSGLVIPPMPDKPSWLSQSYVTFSKWSKQYVYVRRLEALVG